MKKMEFEDMLAILDLKKEQIDRNYRHKYNCWMCKDNGVYPTADNMAVAWNVPSSEPSLRWVLCTNCNFHKKGNSNA